MGSAPNASSTIGGLKMSMSNTSVFSDETAGDVLMYANNPDQTFRIGQNSNGISTVAITSNSMNVFGNITTPNFISSMGIQLGLGDSAISSDLHGVSTTTLNTVAIAASNQAYGIANVSSSNGAITSATFTAPRATFTASNVTFSNSATVLGLVTVGGAANASYPLHVQTTNSSNVSIYSAGDISAFSDRRYKTDVRPIDYATGRLNAISGYTFVRLGDTETVPKRMAGVLAQEIESVLPEVVDADPATGYLHVAYGNIAALLIQATKEMGASRATIAFETSTNDSAFSLPLPETPVGVAPWAHAVVGASGGYTRCYAAVHTDAEDGSQSVVGRAEVAGGYVAIVERGAAPVPP